MKKPILWIAAVLAAATMCGQVVPKPTPTPKPYVQPIPADKLKPLYTDLLEAQLQQKTVEQAQATLDKMTKDFEAKLRALCAEAKVTAEDYDFNLKLGTMTPKKK